MHLTNKLQKITACALIWHEFEGKSKIFIARRADTKNFMPGVFELPGGHIEYGESLEDGLKREILEEFGVIIEVKEPFFTFDYLGSNRDSQTFEIIFFAKLIDSPSKITLNPSDHSEYIWVSSDDLSTFSEVRRSDDPELLALRSALSKLS